PLIELSLTSAAAIDRTHLCGGYTHGSMFHLTRFMRKCLVARDKLPLCHHLVQRRIIDKNQHLTWVVRPKVV
ncbi:MAG TPA: hypothetical protein VII35_09490, partial [Steroidobacteraceae bacterium]